MPFQHIRFKLEYGKCTSNTLSQRKKWQYSYPSSRGIFLLFCFGVLSFFFLSFMFRFSLSIKYGLLATACCVFRIQYVAMALHCLAFSLRLRVSSFSELLIPQGSLGGQKLRCIRWETPEILGFFLTVRCFLTGRTARHCTRFCAIGNPQNRVAP